METFNLTSHEIYLLKINQAKKFLLLKKETGIVEAEDIIHDLIIDGFKIEEIDYKKIKGKFFEFFKTQSLNTQLNFLEIKNKKQLIIRDKTCFICKEMLKESEFGVYTRASNGKKYLQSYCIKCNNEHSKKMWHEVYSKDYLIKDKNNLRRKILYEKQKKNPEFMENRRLVAKSHYENKKNCPEWRKKENERFRLYRLRKKEENKTVKLIIKKKRTKNL